MRNNRSWGIIFFFIILSFGVFIAAFNSKRETEVAQNKVEEKRDEVSNFMDIHYFKMSEKKPEFQLKSDKLKVVNQSNLYFSNPIGRIFQGIDIIKYKALDGSYLSSQKRLKLVGDVFITKDETAYSADEVNYNGQKEKLRAKGNIIAKFKELKSGDSLQILSKTMDSDISQKNSTFYGDVRGVIQRTRKYEGKVKFRADEVNFNLLKSLVKLDKSVKLERNNYFLSSEHAEIFLENFNKNLKYYSLYDDVKLEEKVKLSSGSHKQRKAFAQMLEGHQSSGKIILTGAPRVEQGDDVIKGYQITLRENVELVEVDDSQSNLRIKKKE